MDNIIICKVCGNRFKPEKSFHTLCCDENGIYDAFDCPRCGSQSIVQQRLMEFKTDKFEEFIRAAMENNETEIKEDPFDSMIIDLKSIFKNI